MDILFMLGGILIIAIVGISIFLIMKKRDSEKESLFGGYGFFKYFSMEKLPKIGKGDGDLKGAKISLKEGQEIGLVGEDSMEKSGSKEKTASEIVKKKTHEKERASSAKTEKELDESTKKSMPEKGRDVSVEVINVKNLVENLNDSSLEYIVNYLEGKKYSFITEKRRFASKKELEEFVKSRIIDFLNSYYLNLKQDVSELRRAGKDVRNIGLRLMSIPLKIKIFSAHFTEKDFKKVIELLEDAEKEIKAFKAFDAATMAKQEAVDAKDAAGEKKENDEK